MKIIEKRIVSVIERHIRSGPGLIQVLVGPRQVGKTTAVRQVLDRWDGPSHYATADLPQAPDPAWIQSQWAVARHTGRSTGKRVLLVLDEIQKVSRWSEVVKALFDEDQTGRVAVQPILLGSAALTVQKGASESLAGRFERHYCGHWSWPECREAFGWDLDTWLFYGGYPKAAALAEDPGRWAAYVTDSLIDSVLSRDVLQMNVIAKPALLRQLFMAATQLPAQIVSYNKMLGQLQNAGNTTTLAHYLDVLRSAFLVSGVQRWRGGAIREKVSSPKFVVWNNALINAVSGLSFKDVRARGDAWGRLVENAVGAHILNHGGSLSQLYYWRHGNYEVDYVLERGRTRLLIEVKCGGRPKKGFAILRSRYPKAKSLVVGAGGVPLENFFSASPDAWF